MGDKNYYMNEKIGNSGVADTRNPIYTKQEYTPFRVSGREVNVGDIISPTSKYDETLGSLDSVKYGEVTVDDLRAEQQTNLERLGNALANNIVIAGTTAIGGTLGLVNGIFSAAGEGDIQKLWDNDVNNWSLDVQEKTRELFPIYRGEQYNKKSLTQKLGTGIFWADLIQNLGYAEGALIPGIGMSKVLSSAPSLVNLLSSSLLSSIGEASIEAIHSKRDEVSNKTKMANAEYNRMASEATSPFALGALDSEYNKTLESIEADANNAGNFVFGSNVALLTLSSAFQFGNLFTRGFGTAKRLNGALKRTGNVYSTDNLTLSLVKTGTKKVADAVMEGVEEVSQGVISNTPSNYTDYNTFNSSIFNPEKRKLVSDIWQALGESYSQALQDPETGVEFASGFIIGALGVPVLRRRKFPIGLENNIGVELYDTYKEVQKQRDLADKINARLQEDKKINSYYNGLVRHLSIQDRMNTALDEDNTYDYKTAEAAQFISDVRMFEEAGDIENLKTIINNSIDLSDEGINTIISETSPNGNGPFMSNGNPMPIEDVRMLLKEKIDILNNKIDNYVKDKEYLESAYPNMDSETINNALFLKEQYRDHSSRYTDLLENTYSKISNLLRSSLNKEEYDSFIRDLNKDTFTYNLQSNPKFKEALSSMLEDNSLPISYDERKELLANTEDIVKLKESLVNINKSFEDIINNPNKSAEDLSKITKEAIQQEAKEKLDNLRNSLNSAQTLQEFRTVVDNNIDDIENLNSTLEELESEGSEMAKNYRETSQYNNEVRRVLNESDAEPQVKQDAMKLLQDQFSNSENLEQLANPNSIYINNENAFDEDSDGNVEMSATRFQEAQYALQSAMSQVNNDNKFKDRFSPEYKKPVEKREGTVRGDDRRDTTGDSGTTTTPTVTSSEGLSTTELPIGNITAEMVKEENKGANEEVETPQRPSRSDLNQYYRPAIPELHIEASKGGDFRAFDIVARERENLDFSEIYNYLRDNGAFDYLNNGNLKAGNEIGFMIDPEFEKRVEGMEWHKAPTIFLIDKKNGQVVGSLDEGKSVTNFEGLASLEEKVRKEYSQSKAKSSSLGRFIATPTTKVSKIMIGKIPYDAKERSLADIPNVSSADRKPIFGIIRNGTFVIGNEIDGEIDDDSIIKPDMRQKEGRLYLLIPNGAGKYSPAAVRVKHFNNEEFNLNDVTVSSTPIGEDIKNAISELSMATSQSDIDVAVNKLMEDIYLGHGAKSERDVVISWFSSRAGDGIIISKKVRKPDGTYEKVIINGKEQIKEDKYNVYFSTLGDLGDTSALGTPKNPEDIYNEILGHLIKFNLPLQVSIGKINKETYNDRIINSNILTSNIIEAATRGTWFTTDYFDNEGNLHQAINPASVAPQPKRKVETPVGGTEGAIAGTRIVSVFTNTPYYVDLKTNTIRNDQGRTVEVTNSNRILFDLAWAQDNFGDAANSSMMVDNKVLTPDGKVLDRSKQVYLSSQEAQYVKDIIAGRIGKSSETSATPAQTQVLPIFETSLETQNPIDNISMEYSFADPNEKDGYFELDGKLHKGFLLPIGTINEIKVHITKVPNITKGFGKATEHIGSNTYYAVFPNGKVWKAGTDIGRTHSEMEDYIVKALSGNPQRVKDMSNEKTLLFDPDAVPTVSAASTTPVETPATINQGNTQTGAAYTAQKEQAINDHDEEFEDVLTLRRVNDTEATVWNQEKELAWLSKVLPQLSEQGRVQVVKGLIEVGKKGTLAWGQFDKSIVKLSDIAAEGTAYHEAFHVVFNLLLDEKERQSLYNEAKKLYGEKDDLSLEEDMAEGFREYVMTRQSRSLGKKILDFFKELFTKVTHWNSFRPSLISYYRRINEGKYSSSEFKVSTISELRGATTTTTSFNTLSDSMQENLLKKGWTAEKFDSISQKERDQAVKCIAF